MASMISNVDCPEYKNSDQLESALSRALERHFWPSDYAFTEENFGWLATQIRELTHPHCEADKYELAAATGINEAFVSHVIRNTFVPNGDATALSVGPAPTYRFDYTSVRPVPGMPLKARGN